MTPVPIGVGTPRRNTPCRWARLERAKAASFARINWLSRFDALVQRCSCYLREVCAKSFAVAGGLCASASPIARDPNRESHESPIGVTIRHAPGDEGGANKGPCGQFVHMECNGQFGHCIFQRHSRRLGQRRAHRPPRAASPLATILPPRERSSTRAWSWTR